jgi:hypothetical protein
MVVPEAMIEVDAVAFDRRISLRVKALQPPTK